MENLNLRFLESYKSAEKICTDMYSEKNGITAYINEMESTAAFASNKIHGWNENLRRLKDLRYQRNQMTHGSLSYDDDVFTQSDIDWMDSFYDSLMNQTDPVAQVHKNNHKTASTSAITKPKQSNAGQSTPTWNPTYYNDPKWMKEQRNGGNGWKWLVAGVVVVAIIIILFLS